MCHFYSADWQGWLKSDLVTHSPTLNSLFQLHAFLLLNIVVVHQYEILSYLCKVKFSKYLRHIHFNTHIFWHFIYIKIVLKCSMLFDASLQSEDNEHILLINFHDFLRAKIALHRSVILFCILIFTSLCLCQFTFNEIFC